MCFCIWLCVVVILVLGIYLLIFLVIWLIVLILLCKKYIWLLCLILCRIVLWISFVFFCLIKVLIVKCFVGGVVIIDRLCILFIVMFKVCGIGVVVSVKILILVCNVLIFFFWCILKWCFLLIINKFKFLNFIFCWISLCVLIMIFNLFLVILFRVFFCFFVELKCDKILILIGKLVKWFLKFL